METIATPAPMPGFLSRFAPPSAIPAAVILAPCDSTVDVLAPAERQRLMTACVDECRLGWHGQDIDWTSADRINRLIGETFTRRELMTLLGQYAAAIGPA